MHYTAFDLFCQNTDMIFFTVYLLGVPIFALMLADNSECFTSVIYNLFLHVTK